MTADDNKTGPLSTRPLFTEEEFRAANTPPPRFTPEADKEINRLIGRKSGISAVADTYIARIRKVAHNDRREHLAQESLDLLAEALEQTPKEKLGDDAKGIELATLFTRMNDLLQPGKRGDIASAAHRVMGFLAGMKGDPAENLSNMLDQTVNTQGGACQTDQYVGQFLMRLARASDADITSDDQCKKPDEQSELYKAAQALNMSIADRSFVR